MIGTKRLDSGLGKARIRFAGLVLLGIVALSAVGCSSNSTPDNPEKPSPTTVEPDKAPVNK